MSVKFNLRLNLYNCSILCADLCIPNIFVWATGLEPVTYGLTVNCTIFSKMAEFRRKLGVFVCGYMGCVLFLCVSVCFCSKFLKQPKAIKSNYK